MELGIFSVLLCFVIAFLLSYVSVPLVRVLAFKCGAVDVPKDSRRMHKTPIPRMGGLAIFFGFIVSYLCFADTIEPKHLGILAGALILVCTGIIDDRRPLRAMTKLVFQLIAALIPVLMGLRIDFLTNPIIFLENATFNISFLSIPITIIWIVGLTNALNLIDGLDGLAAGISTIASVSLIVVCVIFGSTNSLIPLIAIAGATIGFLPYNINPAKIFMGDTGALFLGYMLATLSVDGFFKSFAAISFIIPLIVLGLPLFDTSFAIFRRLLNGQPIMKPDRSHLHHKLVDAGFSQRQAVGILCTISGLFSLSSIVWITAGWKRMLIMLGVAVIYCFACKFYIDNKKCETEFFSHLEEEKREGDKK